MPVRQSTARWALLVFVTASAGSPVRAGDGEPCIGDWSEAAPIVARENLTSARDVHEIARAHLAGDLVRITLCREGSRFVYRLVVRDERGRISSRTVDARNPFSP